MKDVCDGSALLAVVHFYCPAIVRLEGMSSGLRLLVATTDFSHLDSIEVRQHFFYRNMLRSENILFSGLRRIESF